MEWYLKALKSFAEFSGRSRRKEYWMFFLINFVISLILLIGIGIISPELKLIVFGCYWLLMTLPSIAVTVRRFHDIGKSGGWIFIYFVPLIGGILFLILVSTEGKIGSNEYGTDPKGERTDEADDMDILDI